MKIKLSPDLLKDIKKLKQKDRRLLDRVEKQLDLFLQNPKHPSLRTHKLTGKIENRWSISISKSVRMVYVIRENQKNEETIAYFIAIGTHDQVYKS